LAWHDERLRLGTDQRWPEAAAHSQSVSASLPPA